MVAIILKDDFKENKTDNNSFEKKSKVGTTSNWGAKDEHASSDQMRRNILLHFFSEIQLIMLVFSTMILSIDMLTAEKPPKWQPEEHKKIIRELVQNKKRLVITLMLNGILILSSGITLLASTTASKRVRIGIRILNALMLVVAFYNVLNAFGMTVLGSNLIYDYQWMFLMSAGLQIAIFICSLKSYKKISNSAPPAPTNSYLNRSALCLLIASVVLGLLQSIVCVINVCKDYCVNSDDCPRPLLKFIICKIIWFSVQTLVGVIGIHASLRNSKKLTILSRFSATTVFAIYSFAYFYAFTMKFLDVRKHLPFLNKEDLVHNQITLLISTVLLFAVMVAAWMPFQDFGKCTWILIKSKDRRGFKEQWVLLDEKEDLIIEKIPFNSSVPDIQP